MTMQPTAESSAMAMASTPTVWKVLATTPMFSGRPRPAMSLGAWLARPMTNSSRPITAPAAT
jgi:hypothetical protein